MPFNTTTFVIFFVVVLGLYRAPLPWRGRKAVLLVASYVFYAAWNPPFVILVWLSTLVDWFVARAIHAEDRVARRRIWLLLSLSLNLGLLGFFKYGGFLVENFAWLVGALGWDWEPAAPSILLPVGISFYTFQTLSYTLDIYRGRARPWSSFLDYALYVTFFPQLVAGPIVRSGEFLPQCVKPPAQSLQSFGWGVSLFIVGLFQKVVVADSILAPISERLFDGGGAASAATAWVGTLAFAGQIYCDFAGYSTCAIGVALCLGFSLPDNFRFPYAAIGFSDFWKRWHMSLSRWLRDYLYIELGGNRGGAAKTLRNLMLTMLLGGLWHGAAWTFVVWGGLHGLYLVGERMAARWWGTWSGWRHPAMRVALGALTLALVCLAWVYFRSGSLEEAWSITLAMVGASHGGDVLRLPDAAWCLLTMGAIIGMHWLLRGSSLERLVERMPAWLWALALAVMLALVATSSGEDRAFIYFRF